MYIKFSYVDKFGRREIVVAPITEAKNAAISLLERSQREDLGVLYILRGDDWHELDYYNLGRLF